MVLYSQYYLLILNFILSIPYCFVKKGFKDEETYTAFVNS